MFVAWRAPERWPFLLIPLWLFLRMALNAIDGMLAREFGQKSRLGAYLNELGDVVSDAALYLPFALLPPFAALWIGIVIVLAVISEFAGVLGPAVGASRRYDGPMGKSDRAFVFGALGLVDRRRRARFRTGSRRDAAARRALVLTIVNRVRAGLRETGTACRDRSVRRQPRHALRPRCHRRSGRNGAAHLPDLRPRVYFANHASHGDFVLIWTCCRPTCASADAAGRRRRLLADGDACAATSARASSARCWSNAIAETRTDDPIQQMATALDEGDSLILFPEGTRNLTDVSLLPFKSGLYRLACACPDVEMVPVWIENLNRVMPKGELIPVPLLCTRVVRHAGPAARDEEKTAIVPRAQRARAPGARPREHAAHDRAAADGLAVRRRSACVLVVASLVGYGARTRRSPSGRRTRWSTT